MLKKDSLKPPTTRLNTEPFAQGASWNRKSSPPSPQVTNRAARAYCAFDGRTKVTDEDVGKAGRKVMIVGGGNFLPETNSEFTPENWGQGPLEKEIPELESTLFRGVCC